MKRACVMIVGLGVMVSGGVAMAQDKPAVPPAPPTAPVADLPSVESLTAKMAKAVGGTEALAKVMTLHTVMSVNMMGQDMEMDSSWSRKGGRLMSVNSPMGAVTMGSDGKVTWMKQGEDYRLMAGDMAKNIGAQASIHMSMLDPTCRDKDEPLTVVGKEKFQDKECYKLSYSSKRRGTGFVFLDAESGLPVGSKQEQQNMTSVLGDWKKVDGVLFFHSIKVEGGQGAGEMKVTKLEVNKPEESAFALPDEVKKLADAEKKPDAPAAAIKLEDLPKDQQEKAKQAVEGLSKMPDVKSIKQMLEGIEMGIGQAPPESKKMMEYMAQEMRAEIKKRGG